MFPTKCAGFTSIEKLSVTCLLSSPSCNVYKKRKSKLWKSLHPAVWGRAQPVAPMVGICDSKDDSGEPVPAVCQQGFQELLAHHSSPFGKILAFVCANECEGKETENRWGVEEKTRTVYSNLSFVIFLCIFKVSRSPLEGERQEKKLLF